jgi:hypothetical protein
MADVRNICERMWGRGRVELDALGIGPVQWLQGWKARIERNDAVAFGEHAILGWDWEGPGVCNTSFQASTSFEAKDVGWRVTKELRREIPKLAQRTGAKRIHVYSLCIDPESAKWFRLLGFEEDEYTGPRCGSFLLRRFVRRF